MRTPGWGLKVLFVGASLWMLGIGVVHAGAGVVQHSDGTTGTITHLGDQIGIYSDAHGNTGPVVISPGLITPAGPHGDTGSRIMTPFGTPPPPNNLTPPPVLPMNPNRLLLPQSPPALAHPAPPSGVGSYGGGAVGR